jgi:parallel beta helix pectate lyase-like protein
VTLTPVNREIPAIRISESIDVVIQDIRVEDAETGIATMQVSCQIIGCSFRTTGVGVTDVGVMMTVFGSHVVRIQQCTFIGEEAGVGVLTLGDGRIEIKDCEFLELGTGTLLGGLTSVLIAASTFEDCFKSIILADSVAATLVGNHIEGSLWDGIRVSSSSPGDSEDGSLTMDSNTIRNSMRWDINLCLSDSDGLAFAGRLSGTGNILGDGYDMLCPADYDWPEGFFADE